jgi:hypothetical protein
MIITHASDGAVVAGVSDITAHFPNFINYLTPLVTPMENVLPPGDKLSLLAKTA